MASQVYPFTNAANYTYDGGEIEISGGVAALLDRRPANALFYNSFNTNENADWSGGAPGGTLNATASVAGGVLVCKPANINYCYWDGPGNSPPGNVGCIRFKYRPNYTGAPPASRAIGRVRDPFTVPNAVILWQISNGNLRIHATDSAGADLIPATNLGVYAFTAGTWYEIEINFDFTAGATRVFVDGVQHGATQIQTGTRDTAVRPYLGLDAINNDSDADFDDLLIFDAVQHTADYTPDWSGIYETIYSISNPTIVFDTGLSSVASITAFTETSVVAAPDAITYTLTIDGTERYWDGGAWAVSDGTYAKSCSAADINANLASLPVSNSTVTFKAFLHSNDGSTFPTLDNVQVDYTTYTPPTPPTPPGFLTNSSGTIRKRGPNSRPYRGRPYYRTYPRGS